MNHLTRAPQSIIRRTWRIWPPGYAFEYSYRCRIDPARLTPLCQELISEVLPLEAITGAALTNIKGSNQPMELQLLDGIATPPDGDELFYLKGSLETEEENEAGKKEVVCKGFDLSIPTAFLDFPDAHSIRNSSTIKTSGAWPKGVGLTQIGGDLPIELHYLRLGIDYFKSYLGTSLLGFAPSVWQTLLFEATDREICLKLLADGVKDRSFNPFSGDSAVGKLDKILQRLFSLSPREELLSNNHRQW